MNYEQFSQKTRSVKSILAHLDGKRLAKIFTDEGSDIWSRQSDLFVVGVKVDGVDLESDQSLGVGQFWFNPIDRKLSINSSLDPREREVVLTFRIFLSDRPYNLPSGITTGQDVEYLPLIKNIGSLKFALDYEQTGIALETNSSIQLENTDGFWDELFDTLIFENQNIVFYSWSPSIPLSEARAIYRGFVKDKTFTDSEVRFNLVDTIFKLRKSVSLGVFTSLDGDLSDSDLDKPKARVYGKVKTMRTIGIDKTLSGYPLGQINGTIATNTITGTGFLQKLSPSDRLKLVVNNEEISLTIESVTNDTTALVTSELELNIVNEEAIVEPSVPYRFKNRRWHVAGHRLHEFSAEITEVISPNRLVLDSVEGLEEGDFIVFGAQKRSILRVSGNQVVTAQAFSPSPVSTDMITREPVLECFFGSNQLVIDRDYSLDNITEAVIEIDPLAEFNISPVLRVGFSMTFMNGSRSVTTAADVDLKTLFKPRDWIISGDITHQFWYEVLDVLEQEVIIRANYAGSNTTSLPRRKSVEYIDDDSLITVSCFGKESGGRWLRTPAQVVRDLILSDADIPSINEAKFSEAESLAPYTVSMVLRSDRKIRDIISDINGSCFGSLYQLSNFDIAYTILNADKDPDLVELKDDDILDFSVKTSNKIVNRVICNYRPFVDVFSGEDTFEVIDFNSDFVNSTSGIEQTREVTLFLYDQSDAETIAQRIAFFNSLSQSVVTVRSKLNLALKTVNDRLFLSLDRLYKRYGAFTRKKLGIINSVSKNESSSIVELNDLSGVFTRVGAIADNASLEFSASDDTAKARHGFIVDDATLTPDNTSEDDLGNNLIG